MMAEMSQINSEIKAIFFQGLFFTFFFSFLLIYGGLGFWGCGFQLMGFWACGVRPAGVFGVGVLYISLYKNNPEEKLC